MVTWIAAEADTNGEIYLHLMDQGTWVRRHPIPFTDMGEARGAVQRLNAKEAGVLVNATVSRPEDELRAERQSRIEELRAKRRAREAV